MKTRLTRPDPSLLESFVPAILAALVLALLCAAPPAAAQVDLDVRTGVYSDESDLFVGGGVLGQWENSPWFYNPNVEWVFVENGDLITFNLDFHRDFDVDGPATVWLGAGPAIVLRSPDRGDDEADPGLNLLAGAGLTGGAVRPYLQGKILISDDTQAVLAIGLRF